jgi:hypothetical protein
MGGEALTYFIRTRGIDIYLEHCHWPDTGPYHAGRLGFLGIENTF